MFPSQVVVWLALAPIHEGYHGPVAPHPPSLHVHIAESDPMVRFGWIQVLYQGGDELHFVGVVDRDQVCVPIPAGELSLRPHQFAGNISVAAGAVAIPVQRTGAVLQLHVGVS